MSTLTSLVINIVVLGSVFLLVALGLTLIFGLGRVVNFAHGALYSFGALCMVSLVTWGVPLIGAIVACVVIGAILGIAIEVGLVRWIRSRHVIDSLLLTFGLSLFFTGIMYEFWGPNVRRFSPPEILAGTVNVFGATSYPTYRLAAAGIAIALVVGLFIVLHNTRWGLHVRATNDDREMAWALGINSKLMLVSVFAVGASLVTVAGGLATPIYGASPIVGDALLIQAFLVIVIGGLGSLRGAVYGAYIVAAITLIGESYVGGQAAMIILFIAVALILLKAPRGILGKGRIE